MVLFVDRAWQSVSVPFTTHAWMDGWSVLFVWTNGTGNKVCVMGGWMDGDVGGGDGLLQLCLLCVW